MVITTRIGTIRCGGCSNTSRIPLLFHDNKLVPRRDDCPVCKLLKKFGVRLSSTARAGTIMRVGA